MPSATAAGASLLPAPHKTQCYSQETKKERHTVGQDPRMHGPYASCKREPPPNDIPVTLFRTSTLPIIDAPTLTTSTRSSASTHRPRDTCTIALRRIAYELISLRYQEKSNLASTMNRQGTITRTRLALLPFALTPDIVYPLSPRPHSIDSLLSAQDPAFQHASSDRAPETA